MDVVCECEEVLSVDVVCCWQIYKQDVYMYMYMYMSYVGTLIWKDIYTCSPLLFLTMGPTCMFIDHLVSLLLPIDRLLTLRFPPLL